MVIGGMLGWLGCSGMPKSQPRGPKPPSPMFQKPQSENSRRIPPGQCRIEATIIGVDTTNAAAPSNVLCPKFPCKVVIRVDRIIGMGAAFPAVIDRGDRLPVIVVLPPASGKEGGPGGTGSSLKLGTIIRANLDVKPLLGGGNEYRIESYRILSQGDRR